MATGTSGYRHLHTDTPTYLHVCPVLRSISHLDASTRTHRHETMPAVSVYGCFRVLTVLVLDARCNILLLISM